MYALLRRLLFLLPAERAHYVVMGALRAVHATGVGAWLLRRLYVRPWPGLARDVFGLRFANPVGLGAGFDKDARWVDQLACLGFGFVEVGTLTPRAQPGNDKPRLFRLSADRALLNRMGFNNGGVEAAVARLRRRRSRIVVGGNIGKNKDTPNEQAVDDYLQSFRALFDVVDYFVVNVSSPNTPGLRALQDKGPLLALLSALQADNRARPAPKPILLKIAPDLEDSQLDDVVEIVERAGIDGIVATNTTTARAGLATPAADVERLGAGGLSGAPLHARALEVVRYLHARAGGRIPIVAVGGIFDAAHARAMLDAGASLVQVWTGFVYEGPGIVRRICAGLRR
ncbi:MAG: quinone-dependent dihydroorotate dehydrogenase [Planctomycetota bacterium]